MRIHFKIIRLFPLPAGTEYREYAPHRFTQGADCALFYPHGLFVRRRDLINLITLIVPVTLIKPLPPNGCHAVAVIPHMIMTGQLRSLCRAFAGLIIKNLHLRRFVP